MFVIERQSTGTGARTGMLRTSHGDVETPCFMPVASKGSVKTLSSGELVDLGVQNMIANAYLLHLRPGTELIREAGGLHGFMNWDRSVFTDSGGFQIIRKGFEPRVIDEGVRLKSPFDGREELFTPSESCRVQEDIGSDVAMFLDDCAPFGSSESRVERAVERTTAWAREFAEVHSRKDQMKFAIAQGGLHRGLRQRSARELGDVECDGFGIGGLCIGESKEAMFGAIGYQLPHLDPARPRYLMGVGTPVDILQSVESGIDIFDSVYPTRNARHRTALTSRGTENVNATNFRGVIAPVEKGCTCPACRDYSRAYIYHLFKAKELLAMRLLTLHNVHFMMELMREIRGAIANDDFPSFKKGFIDRYCGSR